jgi:3-(3-hydroxy-phenyl)propionate hydroxylase
VPGEDERGIWRCVFPTHADENEAELLDLARAADRLAAFVPQSRAAKVIHTNLYAVHQRVATTYRRGRVLLAGDAAHVNNPLGGMGTYVQGVRLMGGRRLDPGRVPIGAFGEGRY